MADHKLDIFQVLDKLNRKDREYFTSLSEDDQKQIQPFVLMRWLTGGKDVGVVMVNEVINPYAFDLTKHKQLLWYLLTVCTEGKAARVRWIKGPSKKSTGMTNSVKVVMEATGYSMSHAVDAAHVLHPADIIEMAEGLGWSSDEIAKVKKEQKARTK